MKIADLKYQSVTPDNPSPNTLGLYADSGTATVFTLISGGTAKSLTFNFTGSVPGSSVATGMGVLATGAFYGATGTASAPATGLSVPYRWIPIQDSNGTNLVIPAYLMR